MRMLFAVAMLVALVATAHPSQAAEAACPADPQAVINTACPCTSFAKHGQYMKCVGQQLRSLKEKGCAPKLLRSLSRCSNSSICGKNDKQVVCCTKTNRAKIATAEKCIARGGRVVEGATSLCEAHCS